MLKRISFSVEIQNGDKSVFRLDNFTHSFAPGLTAITGRNGTGKSMVPEMAMYALFGSKALRGKADDYKKLEVTLHAEVGGKTVYIGRSKKNALLNIDGVETASGTEPVNKAILDLFGYSQDVFNIANAAKQGEIEKLGAMKPAERKRLVDETVGVNVLDALETYIANEIRTAKAVVDTLGPVVDLPAEPVLDSEFTREDIDHQLAAFEAARVEKAKLTAVATTEIGDKPVEPVAPAITETLEELRSQEEARNRLVGELSALRNQQLDLGVRAGDARPEKPVAPSFLADEAALREQYKEWNEKTVRIKAKREDLRHLQTQMPELSPGALAIDVDAETARNFLKAYEANREKIALRDRLRNEAVPQECPACHHKYETADPRLAELEDLLPINPPPYTINDITDRVWADSLKNQIAVLEADVEILTSQIEELDHVDQKLDAIEAYRRNAEAYSKYAKFDELQAKIAAIVVPESVQGKISSLHDYTVCRATWERDIKAWQEKNDAIRAAEAELYSAKYSVDIDAEIAKFKAERDKHIAFDAAWTAHLKDCARIGEENQRREKAAIDLDQWSRCRKAIPLVRAKVKGFLLPSLNRAASHLVGEMTNGTFSNITVTDEFEITVDGQRMETLSGGGKAVANLALRLALGQVLTNRVFSCVLLDEIDASCDDERAASMAAAVRNLSERDIIRQIVLISHKPSIEADHFIRMEEMGGESAMEAAA